MLLGIKDSMLLSLLFFAIANFGCHTATVFYNALMVNIAPKNRIGLISGLGKTFGYIGAILALYLMKPIVLKSGYQATFLPTGILFLVFSLPCLIFIKDRETAQKPNLIYFLKKNKILEIFRTLRKTAFGVHALGGLLDFLKAVFFGLCAVNAVVLFMSVYATKVFGMNESGVINLIGFSAIFAIVGSLVSGFISDYLGHRRCLAAVFIFWIICFWIGTFARNLTHYWFVGALVGITLGATWVVSRSLAVSLVPEAQIGEVFGLFNLVGYLSAIVGAIFWGLILLLLYRFGEWGYRIALLSLISFMVPGLIFLLRIPLKERKA
jgi:UMF1 family MFS transporter